MIIEALCEFPAASLWEDPEKSTPTYMELVHSNSDDPHYSYRFSIEGTENELKIIREFCEGLNRYDVYNL